MNSLDIAKKYNKRHSNVLRQLRRFSQTYDLKMSERFYRDANNRRCILYEVEASFLIPWLFQSRGIRNRPAKEELALTVIEQLLGVKLLRQFPILNYFVDGYDPVNNICYEIDEEHHQLNLKSDAARQQQIESALGCKFVRVTV